MTTERLYYHDPYRRTFTARVLERLEIDGRPAVVLDRSAFYPTGGGQPHDTGSLNGVAVADVVERETDKAVVHLLAGPLERDGVDGEINWARRFELMQQHTGQHILSAVFGEVLAAETVSVHFGADYATLDLDKAPLTEEDLERVEEAANAVVWENRPVSARFVEQAELATLPLRKPPAVSGPIRIVEVAGLDWSPCGGTHVRASGEVGLIKIVRAERRGAETRAEFLCGARALADYRAKNRAILDLALHLSVGYRELAEVVSRLEGENKALRKERDNLRDELLSSEAAALLAGAEERDGIRVVRRAFSGREAKSVRALASRLAEEESCLALLGSAGEKATLIFARSDDLALDVRPLLNAACAVVGGRGGGQPGFAQGGGPQVGRLDEALEVAYRAWLSTREEDL
jgi:alanyl-tRNA synthetase